MFPRKLYPGQSYTATEQEALARQAMRAGQVTGTGVLTVAGNAANMVIRDNSDDVIYARITGAPTGSSYPWVEVARNGSTWDDVTVWPGRSGTAAALPAVELAGRTDVPVNAIVELTPLPGSTGLGFSYGAGEPPEDIFGGISSTSLQTSASSGQSFPSGYSALTSLSGTNLPTVSETVRVSFPTALPFDAVVAVFVSCRANVFAATVSGATYGFFVVTANITNGAGTGGDVVSMPYPGRSGSGDEPAYAAGNAFLPFMIVGTAGNSYIDINITYAVTFFSNVAWGGVSAPSMRLRVCTGATAMINPEFTHSDFTGDWINTPFGTRSCPSVATI